VSYSSVGLRMTVGSTLAVIALAVVEGPSGPEVVADVAGLVGVVLLALSVAAMLLRVAARRTRGNWPGVLQLGLGVLAVLLMCVVGTVAVWAHTASGRFQDRADAIPLPEGYRPVPVAEEFVGHGQSLERVVRAWSVPAGADPCADLEAAFTAWAEPPVEGSSRGAACVFDSEEQSEKAEVSLTADGRTVHLEMWLERSSLLG
jgi:hypothetical protein